MKRNSKQLIYVEPKIEIVYLDEINIITLSNCDFETESVSGL